MSDSQESKVKTEEISESKHEIKEIKVKTEEISESKHEIKESKVKTEVKTEEKPTFRVQVSESNQEIEMCNSFQMQFNQEKDDHEKARILSSFVDSYLTKYKPASKEPFTNAIFIELISQIRVLCGNFLCTTTSISNMENETQKKINDENKAKNLESACVCINILKSLNTCNSIVIATVATNILVQGFVHCKDSEIIYGKSLEQFKDQLAVLFKDIEGLLKVVLKKLQDVCEYQICFPGPDYFSLIKGLFKEIATLCQVVTCLDVSVEFKIWTAFARFISEHRRILAVFDMDSTLLYLASKLLEIIDMSELQLDSNSREEEKMRNRLALYLNVSFALLNFLRNRSKDKILAEFKIVLIHLFEYMGICFSTLALAKSGWDAVRDTLTKYTYILVGELFSDEEFLRLVLCANVSEYKEYRCGLILLKLCILQFLERKTQELKKSTFDNIYECFLSNKAEDDEKMNSRCIPKCSVIKTVSVQLLTLYEFASNQMRIYFKNLPDSEFKILGRRTVFYAVRCSDLVGLLFSDIWISRLSLCNEEFIKDRCGCIIQEYFVDCQYSNPKLHNILWRMCALLSEKGKKSLVEEFSAVEPLKCILDEKFQHRHGTPDLLSLENLQSPEHDSQIRPGQMIRDLMPKLNNFNLDDEVQLVKRACTCVELCIAFRDVAGSAEILQFIEFAAQAFKSDVYEVQIAVLTFIKALATKHLPENEPEYGKIAICMARLFSEAIHSKNYIVKYEALNTFRYFAKSTPHIRIVQEIARQDPSLKPIIKSYLSVDSSNILTEEKMSEYLEQQLSMFSETKIGITESSKHFLENLIPKK